MAQISEIFTVTTIVKTFYNDESVSSATGFFFKHNGRLFLITNKHVIYGDNYGQNTVTPTPHVNKIKINLHTSLSNIFLNQEITIDLIINGHRQWLEHSYPFVDVVLIPISIDQTKYFISNVDRTTIDCNDVVIDDFERIFVIGYPYGWYDTLNNLPVVRIGHLSSPFKVAFKGKPMMVGDVITHPGMSGGPVIMKINDYIERLPDGSTQMMLGHQRRILVGVNSGQYMADAVPDERLNLISIWHSDVILQILGINCLL